nr:probable transcription factor At1g61730 [Arachis hypogaea]
MVVSRPQSEQEDSSEVEEAATSSDEDEDIDEGEDEREKHVLVPKKLQPQKVSKLSSSSSKPSPKLKSQPSASVSQTKSGSKRAAKNSIDHSNQPKRGKKAQEDHAIGSIEEDPQKSKSLFQRVFNEEDAIGILKGLSEFIAKTGKEPYKCVDEFYDFMKGSNLIRANVSCMQLKDKIRRLKKKFENNLEKEKNGKGTTLKPHELEAFQLEKNVWGHDGRGGEAVLKETTEKDTVNNEKAAKITPKKALVPPFKWKS